MPFIDYLINNKTLGKNDANEILKEIESEGENLDSVLIRRGVDPNALSRLRGSIPKSPSENWERKPSRLKFLNMCRKNQPLIITSLR